MTPLPCRGLKRTRILLPAKHEGVNNINMMGESLASSFVLSSFHEPTMLCRMMLVTRMVFDSQCIISELKLVLFVLELDKKE
jgi:hypothetical protein